MTTAKAPAKKKTIARPPAPLVGPQRRSRNIDMPIHGTPAAGTSGGAATQNNGRHVGRNPTPGVPRRVGSRNIDMPMPRGRALMASGGAKASPVKFMGPPIPRPTPQQTQRAAGRSIVDQILGGIGDRWREMTSGGSNSQFPGVGGIGDYLKRQGH